MKRTLQTAVLTLALAVVPAATTQAADSVIVKYKRSATAAQVSSLAGSLGLDGQVGEIRRLGAVVIATDTPRATARAMSRSPLVAYAEPNKILRTAAVPNDPLFPGLYGMDKIDAPEGWDAAGLASFPASGGLKVGIVDTGIQSNHPDLVGKVVDCARSTGLLPILSGTIQEGNCADDNGHGTHVAGTIAAKANNAIGVAGVAFNSPLSICKALSGPLGVGSTADVANCITWLHDKGAKVISMSLGGGATTTLKSAVDYAWKGGAANGSVLIAAAGNDGDATLNYPAAYPNVVSVAATDQNDARADFSNANSDVEIAAPGVDIESTWNDGGYNTISGTSMATPHVSGVTAIIRARYPSSTAAQIVAKLDGAVDDLGPAGRDASFGFGRVDLVQAATE